DLRQLRRQLEELAFRQQAVADTDEFGDAPVDATHAGEQVTQLFVGQPFHGGQGDLHGDNPGNAKGRVVYEDERAKCRAVSALLAASRTLARQREDRGAPERRDGGQGKRCPPYGCVATRAWP